MARLNKSSGVGVWVGKKLDSVGAISGGDPGSDAFSSINGNGEGCFVSFTVFGGHRRKIESLCPFRSYWSANKPTAMIRHECDRFWSNERGRTHEIRFVLSSGIISDDDKLSCLKISDDLIDGGKFQFAHGA